MLFTSKHDSLTTSPLLLQFLLVSLTKILCCPYTGYIHFPTYSNNQPRRSYTDTPGHKQQKAMICCRVVDIDTATGDLKYGNMPSDTFARETPIGNSRNSIPRYNFFKKKMATCPGYFFVRKKHPAINYYNSIIIIFNMFIYTCTCTGFPSIRKQARFSTTNTCLLPSTWVT
jgi:hypothetical protein